MLWVSPGPVQRLAWVSGPVLSDFLPRQTERVAGSVSQTEQSVGTGAALRDPSEAGLSLVGTAAIIVLCQH